VSRSLHVLLYGQVVGEVTQTPQGGHTFSYDTDYLSAPNATPLSLSMPLTTDTYPRGRIVPWMLGLLPDRGEVRDRWAQLLSVSPENPFALLEHMGLDCAGAVQFVAGSIEDARGRGSDLIELDESAIGERLASLRDDPDTWTVSGERWSLAGAQAKFALARDRAGRWYEATGAAPSTHIIKPGIGQFRDQALNEHICMRTATRLGIAAARTEFIEFDGHPALVVTRYDRRRVRDSEEILRVHQEDMCQALSVYPNRKYESSGGPTAARIANLLATRSSAPIEDVRPFVRAVAYNYLIGAPDAHAKNYSVLLAGADVRAAPLYDIASGFPYEPTRADHELDLAAMAIGGKRAFGTVEGRHWDRLAKACQVDVDWLRLEVSDLCESIPDAMATEFAPYATSHAGLRDRMLTAVKSHVKRSLAALSAPQIGVWTAPAHSRARTRIDVRDS
jgi:serine/threonine-protein kinase HipA